MTDADLTPAEGDTPGPFATPAQDADVRALLGTLRAEDVPMPDDVVRRINAAVVAERVASTLPDSPAALVDAEDGAGQAARTGQAGHGGTVTVLPTAEQRRGPSYAGLTKLLAVAAAVVVVVGIGSVLVKGTGGLSADSTSGGAASTAPEAAGGAAVNASGLDYSAKTLSAQVDALVQGKVATRAATGQSSGQTATPATPSPQTSTTSDTGTNAYSLADRNTLAVCVNSLTGGAAATPVAVDQGSYDGKPAEIVVLPTEGDTTSLDVWVVAPGCGTGPEPTVLEFQRVPRP